MTSSIYDQEFRWRHQCRYKNDLRHLRPLQPSCWRILARRVAQFHPSINFTIFMATAPKSWIILIVLSEICKNGLAFWDGRVKNSDHHLVSLLDELLDFFAGDLRTTNLNCHCSISLDRFTNRESNFTIAERSSFLEQSQWITPRFHAQCRWRESRRRTNDRHRSENIRKRYSRKTMESSLI